MLSYRVYFKFPHNKYLEHFCLSCNDYICEPLFCYHFGKLESNRLLFTPGLSLLSPVIQAVVCALSIVQQTRLSDVPGHLAPLLERYSSKICVLSLSISHQFTSHRTDNEHNLCGVMKSAPSFEWRPA